MVAGYHYPAATDDSSSRQQPWTAMPQPSSAEICWQDLVRAACEARQRAYAPYSNFAVGAALMTADQSIFQGANVENASFGLTICAERVAMTAAWMHGHRQWLALVVACKGASAPCGACRQFLAEFAAEPLVGIVDPDAKHALKIVPFAELLPLRFSFGHQ
jgi:cytidine deaminase